MARNVSLLQLRTDISNQCDFTVASASRYSSTLLNRLINQSIQRFRERVSAEGMTHFLVSSSGTLVGQTIPFAFEVLDLSAVSPSIVRTYGLDVTINGIVRTLAHRPFNERNEYSDMGPGIPVAWAQYQTRTLAVFPSRGGDPYTVWYLPVLADLVNDADTWDGVAGWENWVVWDVVCQLAARDNYEVQMQQFSFLRDGIWQDIIRGASKVTAVGGGVVGRDTVGRRAKPVLGGGVGIQGPTGPTGPTGPAGSGGSGTGSMADTLMLMGG